ncbi:UNVERIFIED_CONTAM: hypothetical protein GTU68_055729, partial [Idotea baltica]|nr:hypothetical protein [Idotea baltica]
VRRYNIIFIIHPKKLQEWDIKLYKYQNLILKTKGQIHFIQNWGQKQLSYPINSIKTACYINFSFSCSGYLLVQLEKLFLYNDSILRKLIIKQV